MTDGKFTPLSGHCTCGEVRYRMLSNPLFVHCCHCRWCQRETGSAFVLNAVIERARVKLLQGTPELVLTPSFSGRGQKIMRCPKCRIALWSHYPQAGDNVAFVRVGTLDQPDLCPPDVHIYTASKLAWVKLPENARVFAEFYDPPQVWPEESRARFRATRN